MCRRQPLEYEDGPNLLSYTKKNTSNQGDDKKAAEKDSVQVSEGFTFDLAESHRTFFSSMLETRSGTRRHRTWTRRAFSNSGRGFLYLNVCVYVRMQHSSCFYSR